MQLVERHIINKSHPFYEECDAMSFLSKNLYNKANYIIRQEFLKTNKDRKLGRCKTSKWIRYNDLRILLQNAIDSDYYSLPTKVSQKVIQTLDYNWKIFFTKLRGWIRNPNKSDGRPKLPKYKHKTNGRNVVIYTKQAISKEHLKRNKLWLSKTKIKINTKQDINSVQQVRIVPRKNQYIIEVIYNKTIRHENINKNKIAGIDLGLNNLATVTSNQNNVTPLLINGRPLKSINQYFNKKRAKLDSFSPNKTSNKLIKLSNKRHNKVNDYLHNCSRIIVNHLLENNIGTIIIGKNTGWKNEINIGHKNNQEFVYIPHTRFIQMISYKCQMVGIDVMLTEESYTSKCSFIDFESLEKKEQYLGKRRHRGLFVSKHGFKLNADCNGSGNIIRKVFPSAFADGIQGVVARPIRVTPYKQVVNTL